ncbi:hypothetical protein pipiens_009131 [Culex pipiens pipiens]|uniref:SCP domain-containing protein n=1 Tax=Culex pipiens pipiens TaxID=38569 RepID=A0ABD1DGT5_CULPP
MIKFNRNPVRGVFLLVIAATSAQEDYCDPDLCDPGEPHVGCNNPNEPSRNCPPGDDTKKFVFTDAEKQLLVDLHNEYRNKVAKGELDWLPKAANMVAMSWDDDLAYLAELNSNQCAANHDKCRNTKKYPDSGQNIDTMITNATSVKTEDAIRDLVQGWWDERHEANAKMVKKMYKPSPNVKVLHFTMLTRDIANRVGCGMVQYKKQGWIWINLVCNYSYTNMLKTPIYAQGEPCSQCTSGCDAKFDGLCNTDEPVDLS